MQTVWSKCTKAPHPHRLPWILTLVNITPELCQSYFDLSWTYGIRLKMVLSQDLASVGLLANRGITTPLYSAHVQMYACRMNRISCLHERDSNKATGRVSNNWCNSEVTRVMVWRIRVEIRSDLLAVHSIYEGHQLPSISASIECSTSSI